MTEQEFRDQVLELGLTIEVTSYFDYIHETRASRYYIYHSRRTADWCTIIGKFRTHENVLDCVLEWQQAHSTQIIDPIIIAAKLAEKKP